MLFSQISILAKAVLDVGNFPLYDVITLLVIVTGVTLFARWLCVNRFGADALRQSRLRKADMPIYLPVIVIAAWLGLTLVSRAFAEMATSDMLKWQGQFAVFASSSAVEIVLIVVILIVAKKSFADGLKGFGLRAKNVFTDLRAAAILLLTVWSFIFISLALVLQFGRFLKGSGFELEQNEGLSALLGFDNVPLRVLIIFFVVVITPIFEEFLFRGILQSYLRNIGAGPWQSIFIISLIFSSLHPLTHFPALMILSVCMGYAYEKSGSILRPIFVHLFFNGMSVSLSLLASSCQRQQA